MYRLCMKFMTIRVYNDHISCCKVIKILTRAICTKTYRQEFKGAPYNTHGQNFEIAILALYDVGERSKVKVKECVRDP